MLKNVRLLFIILAILNYATAIVCAILFFTFSFNNEPAEYAPIVVPAFIYLTATGTILLFIAFNFRVYPFEEKKRQKVNQNQAEKPKFIVGQRVKTAIFVTIDGYTFAKGSVGTIIKESNHGICVVEFDEKRGDKFSVQDNVLKSLAE